MKIHLRFMILGVGFGIFTGLESFANESAIRTTLSAPRTVEWNGTVSNGSSSNTLPVPVPMSQPEVEPKISKPKLRFVTVKRGETLADIAKREYGLRIKWRELYSYNKKNIRNPDRLDPGQVVMIPATAPERAENQERQGRHAPPRRSLAFTSDRPSQNSLETVELVAPSLEPFEEFLEP